MEFELRKWQETDIESCAHYANNKKIANYLRNGFPHPYTLEDAKNFIAMTPDEQRQCMRTISVNGEAVGSVGIFLKNDVYCKSAELGYWLGEPFWGKGIMTEAVKRLCDYSFAHYDIVRIFAEPFAQNKGSRRVLEKAGFKLEGILKSSVFKNDRLTDSCMYALIRK